MPFRNYSPKAAKALFKSSSNPPATTSRSTSRLSKPESTDSQSSSLSQKVRENLEKARSRLDAIKKEKYDTDLVISRMNGKAAIKAKIEAAQRAALDDTLRAEALEEFRNQETPGVVEKLTNELEPKIRADLLVKLRSELRPKVHNELKTELLQTLTDEVYSELKTDLKDEAIDELKVELRNEFAISVRDELYHDLYPEVIAQLKDDYRDTVLVQLRGELEAEALQQHVGTNGYHHDNLDPALRAESEASDIINAPSELAVLHKRRYSDTFQGEDGDTRSKKLRMVNSDSEQRYPEAAILPAFRNFATQALNEMQPVDESLEEGEKADVEDEIERRVALAAEGEEYEERLEEVDQLPIPSDVDAEAGDEMSVASANGNIEAGAGNSYLQHHEQLTELATSSPRPLEDEMTIAVEPDATVVQEMNGLNATTVVQIADFPTSDLFGLREDVGGAETEEIEFDAESVKFTFNAASVLPSVPLQSTAQQQLTQQSPEAMNPAEAPISAVPENVLLSAPVTATGDDFREVMEDEEEAEDEEAEAEVAEDEVDEEDEERHDQDDTEEYASDSQAEENFLPDQTGKYLDYMEGIDSEAESSLEDAIDDDEVDYQDESEVEDVEGQDDNEGSPEPDGYGDEEEQESAPESQINPNSRYFQMGGEDAPIDLDSD